MKTFLAAAVLLGAMTWGAAAAPLCDKLGFAGLMARCNKGDDIELTLAAGKPLHETGKIVLESGAYYEIQITADGSAELAIEGPAFLRAIWIDEIVINKIEVRPMAIDSMEFDAAGEAEIGFIPIKPGRYELRIRGAKADSQKLMVQIK